MSLSALSIVYTVGKSRGEVDVRVASIENNVKDIKKQQATTNSEILKNRLLFQTEVTNLYKELKIVQDLDKEVVDDKFDLIIEHGVKYKKDKDILYRFFDVLDSKRDSDISRLHNDMSIDNSSETTKNNSP